MMNKEYATMTCQEIFDLAPQMQGWTKEQFQAHPCYAYSKKHYGVYATPGSHSVYFRASDSPSGRCLAGGYILEQK